MGDYKKAGRAQGARRQIDKTEYFQALDAIALIGHHDTSHNLAVRRNIAVNKSDNAPSGSLLTADTCEKTCNSQSLMDRLPNELLCAIFLLCGDPSPTSAFPRCAEMHTFYAVKECRMAYSRSAAILGRVCSRWYAVTRGFPALWTLVDVAYPSTKAKSVLNLCLRYSAGLPLTLWISQYTQVQYQEVDPGFMANVAKHAHRWQEISIELLDVKRRILQPLTCLPSGAFSSLGRARVAFVIMRQQPDYATIYDDLWKLFLTSPKLNCMDLARTQCFQSGLPLAPLRQLTSLGLHDAEPDMVAPLLKNCTKLELLCIEFKKTNIFLPFVTPIHLPHLRILLLRGSIDWTTLFTSLTAPVIDRLDMAYSEIPYHHVASMLARSSARIRMLTIHRPILGREADFLDFIRSRILQDLEILSCKLPHRRETSDIGGEAVFDNQPYLQWHGLQTNADPSQAPDMSVPKNHDIIPTLAERSVVDKPGRARIRSLLSAMSRKTSCQPAIDRLPNEILCAIFFICGDPSSASAYPRDIGMHTYGKERYEIQRYSRSAALLGRVCVRWYAVTRGFPSLWTVVDIAYPTKEATSVLTLCLRYSSDLPLSLWITRSLDPDARKRAVDPRFMSLVAADAHRWREISMEFLDEIRVLEPLVSLPHGAFSSLEQGRIEFQKLEAREDTLDTRLWNMFFTSPKLRCVDLTRTNFIRSGLASAPLQQLTSLGMHSAMPDMVPAVLSTCTSLELLCIQIEPMALGIAGLQTLPIPFSSHLPRLRVLMLCGPYDWAPLCNSLTAPALDRLDVARINIGPYIERMLVRSSARLRMLTIYRPGLGQGDIMLSLVRSPPLRSLRILRYTISYPGSADIGWEDAFDLRPFIPQGVIQAVGAAEAEQSYIKLCEGTSSYGASPS
ncbi:uncharacterized protein SCHCODRAFT_02663783 [Schizophyllum commune H4-8]|nr:uncharacterized protein SCHCODRAFT_02663783 [Schizophyllum commune H4-8]KAI5898963.1 hypothetical protein SCHCODRAFT_02663783 [Schizophyllum commune H4-8]